MNYPEVIHQGAGEGVTGSCHLLRLDADHSLLIDFGLFQGIEAEQKERLGASAIDFGIEAFKLLIVTHVHADHIGRIPHLLAAGIKGPILCSEPSAALLPIVLEDAFKQLIIIRIHVRHLQGVNCLADAGARGSSWLARSVQAGGSSITSKPCLTTTARMSCSWLTRLPRRGGVVES